MHWLSIKVLRWRLASASLVARRALSSAAPPRPARRRGAGRPRPWRRWRHGSRSSRRELSTRREPRRGGGAAQPVPRPDRRDDRARRRARLHAGGRRRASEGRRGRRRARTGRRRRRAPARLDRPGPRGRRGGRGRIFTGPPERRDARAVELSYLYAEEDARRSVHEALGVPARGRSGRIGWLGVFSRDRRGPIRRRRRAPARGARASASRPAIENARRFREARQLADLDSLTGLHNRRYFYETLGREVDRAQRYQRRLSLVIVDVDGFKEINDRIGHLAGDAVLARDRRAHPAGRALGRHPVPGGRRRVRRDRPRGEVGRGPPARRADPAGGLVAADRAGRPRLISAGTADLQRERRPHEPVRAWRPSRSTPPSTRARRARSGRAKSAALRAGYGMSSGAVLADHARGHPGHHRVGRHVLGHDAAGADDRVLPHRHAGQDRAAEAEICAAADRRPQAGPRRLVPEQPVEVARVVRVPEDRRLGDHRHVVLERHRGGDGVVDEDLAPDEDAPPDADAAPPVERRAGGRRQGHVACDDVQPAAPQGSHDLHALGLGANRDVAPELLEHVRRLRRRGRSRGVRRLAEAGSAAREPTPPARERRRARSRGDARKGGERAARRAVHVVRPSGASEASCSERRQAAREARLRRAGADAAPPGTCVEPVPGATLGKEASERREGQYT